MMSESTEDPAGHFQTDVLARLSALQASIAKTSETFASQVSVILSTQLKIRSTQAEMTANVADTKALVEEYKSDLSELYTFIKDTFGQVGADQVRLRVEIMARIDRLQATLDLVREDARVNWATADTAMNRVKNYREEIDNLTAMISAMERRYQTLSSIVDGLRDLDTNRSNGS